MPIIDLLDSTFHKYDNTTSGLISDKTKDALDEVSGNLDTHEALTNAHIDWTSSGGTIHIDNYIENVPTVLSNGTESTIVVNVTSDGGTDDLVLTAASTTKAGIMTKVLYDEHVINTSHSSAAHAPASAEQNVQSDWTETNTELDSYILNKENIEYTSPIPVITATVGGLLDDADAVKFAAITGTNSGDEIHEYATAAEFPVTGISSYIYVDLTTKTIHRWTGTVYEELSVGAVPNNSTITLTAGTGLSTGGAFTLDQGTDEEITLNLDIAGATLGGILSGTDISIDASGNVSVVDDSHLHSNYLLNTTDTLTGDLSVTGNLTVSGTTTTLNTATLEVEDKNIEIGKVSTPTDITADGGGITLLGDINKTIIWHNTTDTWDFNQGISITGNILVSGTVDGVDIAAEETRLSNTSGENTGDQISSDFDHDSLTGFVADEHIDWSLTNAKNIHADNYTDTDTTYTSADFTLSGLSDTSITAPADGQVLTYDTTLGWQPEDNSSRSPTEDNHTATAEQTVFTTTYTVGNIGVYVGGVKVSGDDYTATDGTSVTFDYPQDEGTWVQFLSDTETVAVSNSWSNITDTPTTLSGYGITDASYAKTEYNFDATAGQTEFSCNYNPSDVEVFVEGIRIRDTKITATNGTSITLEAQELDSWVLVVSR